MVNDEILHKWINEELTEEELQSFKLRPEYDSLVSLYKNTEGLAAPTFNGGVMLSEILKKRENKIHYPQNGATGIYVHLGKICSGGFIGFIGRLVFIFK